MNFLVFLIIHLIGALVLLIPILLMFYLHHCDIYQKKFSIKGFVKWIKGL
jgi:hypothetical protein